jgi:DNA-binding NarL/FixJ family response regulator
MIYLLLNNNDIKLYWQEVIASDDVKALDQTSDIFNIAISSQDKLVLCLDIFDDIDSGYKYLNQLPKNLNIIILRSKPTLPEGAYLIKKGVKSYSHNLINRHTIGQILEAIDNNNVWMYPELMQYIISHITLDKTVDVNKLDILTSKEQEVAKLVAQGKSNQAIADILPCFFNE